MSYDALEISNHDGQVVHFYEFRWGNTIWRYNSSDRDLDITVEGITETFVAEPIVDNGITLGGEQPADMRIELAADLPLVDLFRGTPPSENVRVLVLRKHVEDIETSVFFAGKIDNLKRTENGSATLFCSIGKQRRGGLRLTWSRTCPHVLYDGQCRLLLADFAYTATISAVTGNGFTITAPPEKDAVAESTVGFFDGGILSWDADGLGTLERRAIESGSSDTEFTLFGRSDGLEVGQVVTLHPGCDRTTTTCNDKFDNLQNYGGITQMPGESPYAKNIF